MGSVLYLASASRRRLDLLRQAGVDPHVRIADVDEAQRPGEPPEALVVRLAERKARAAAEDLPAGSTPGIVLGADTAVVLDGIPLGKPQDESEALEMLTRLSGRRHDVLTGVFLLRTDDGRSRAAYERTAVRFRDTEAAELQEYVSSGEPMDKAGAYGIQGLGGRLVREVDGSWNNVVGLPVERFDEWLESIGCRLADFRRGTAD